MQDYQKMYAILFNTITDAILCIQQGFCDRAEDILIRAQQETEERYITKGE